MNERPRGRELRTGKTPRLDDDCCDDEEDASSSLDVALALAASGLPVFPCAGDKRPAIPKARGGNGFHDASTDPDRIREMWEQAGPAAQLIATPTGPASGFDVLDVDPRHGGDTWEIENSDRLSETRMHSTPSGGRHYLFAHADGVRNIQDGKTIAPGIDVRGAGGYICHPPSSGYTVIHDVDIAPWPDWLLPLVRKNARPPPPPPDPASYATPAKVSDNRLRAFIDREVRRVRDAPVGARHGARLSAARSIGGVAAEAGLSDAEAEEMLIAARPPEIEEEKERRTIRDGLAYGRAAPIDLNTLPDSAQFRGPRPQRGNGHAGNGAAAPQPGGEGEPPPEAPPVDDWPEPVDFMAAQLGAPVLKEHHVPPSLWPFISDNAERMGVATSSIALCAIVACSAAINEEWKIQPKRNDWDWTEEARLWAAILGAPSVLKSPVIALATKPIELLDIKAMERWNTEQAAHAAWKEAGDETVPEPKTPPRDRFLVESATIEALQEVLRDDAGGKLRAPLGKVLVRQDELEEFLANMDKYSTNNKGTDRGAWLRAYNGGRHSIDRIGRGSFATKSWSCCLLGGIQPDVIRDIAKRTTDNGLIQRFMLDVPGPQAAGLDRAPNLAARDLYRALFPALVALHPTRNDEGRIQHVTLHADAHEAREDIEGLAHVMQVMPDASSRLASTFGKWPGLFARLCLTFHLIEAAASRVRNPGGAHPPLQVVTAETANRVSRYMRAVLAPSLLRAETLMFGTTQTEHANWISQHILIHRLERITARDITRAYGAMRAPEERPTLYSVMDSLCLFGWLAPIQRSDAQPPITWRVNPHVHILYAERAEAERTRRAGVAEAIARERAVYRGADV